MLTVSPSEGKTFLVPPSLTSGVEALVSGVLGNVEYPFITITPRTRSAVPVKVPPMNLVDVFENDLDYVGIHDIK